MCFRVGCFKADVDFVISYLDVVLIGVHFDNSIFLIGNCVKASLHVGSGNKKVG